MIVFAIGMDSTAKDATHLLHRPGLLLRSVLAMYVGVPLAAFVLNCCRIAGRRLPQNTDHVRSIAARCDCCALTLDRSRLERLPRCHRGARERLARQGLVVQGAAGFGVADRLRLPAHGRQRPDAPLAVMPQRNRRLVEQSDKLLLAPGVEQCAQTGDRPVEVPPGFRFGFQTASTAPNSRFAHAEARSRDAHSSPQ